MTSSIMPDWTLSTVGEQFDVQLGKMLDAARNIGEAKPYVGNRAVQWGEIDVSAVGSVPMTPSDMRRYRLRRGDLLVCEGGEVGRAAIWRNELPECYFQKALHRLRAKSNYDVRLMLAFLEYWASLGGFSNYVTQTSIAHLPREKFVQMPLPLPDKWEQKQLSDLLDDVHGEIAILERLISKQQAIKLGMMQQLLTGRTRLAGFSDPWLKTSLGDISAFITKGATPTTYGFKWESAGVPFLRSECVSEHGLDMAQAMFISTAANQALRRSRVTDGDILMTITGYVGRVVRLAGISSANINQHIARIRVRDQQFDGAFVYHYLSQPTMRAYYETIVTGQAYPQISLRQVRDTEIPTLPIKEQRAIAAILSGADQEIAISQHRLVKARAIKQGMMQQLLTGRTRLPVQEAAA